MRFNTPGGDAATSAREHTKSRPETMNVIDDDDDNVDDEDDDDNFERFDIVVR